MPFSEKEMREDLRKVRFRKYIYFLGGLGILGLSIALVVIFFAKRDWPALLLAAVGAFWSVVLFYQACRTRGLGGLLKSRLEEYLGAEPPEAPLAPAEGDGEAGMGIGDDEPPRGGAPGEP